MNNYKRLTNNNLEEYNPEYDFCMGCKYFGEPYGCNRPNGTCGNYDRFIEIYNRLADLEDKIENRTLIELPCNVGDTVYRVMVDKRIKQPYEYKVIGFWYSIDNKCNNVHLGRYIDGVFVSSISVPFSEFNRMLFLTKAEAEAKLKGE